MKWSQQQMDDYLAKRHLLKHDAVETDLADDGPEFILQRKIVAWAKQKGYPYLSFPKSPKARGFLPPGWPDITLYLPQKEISIKCDYCLQEKNIKIPRVVSIELKSRGGALTNEQTLTRLQIMQLGHEFYVCRSWKRFLAVIYQGE